MARQIVITGGKGGVGKTTCCAYLGYFLARLGARVVMLDVDIGLNNLDVVVGIDNLINYDIVDIVCGKCRVRQALIQHPKNPLLYILPSSHCLNVGKVHTDDLKKIIMELSSTFDYILIDCPAGIGAEFYRAVYLASEAIIITTPSITAIRDADKTAELICGCGINSLNLIINRVRTDLIAKHLMLKPQDIASSLNLTLLGTITESDALTAQSAISGNLFEIQDKSILQFENIAKNIHLGIVSNTRKQQLFSFIKRRKQNV